MGPTSRSSENASAHSFITTRDSIQYPMLQSELEILQNRHLQRGMNGFRSVLIRRVSLKKAAEEFLANMNDNRRLCRDVRERLAEVSIRIHNLVWNFGRSTSWSPDIIFAVFNDLDIMFFNGVLYHRVYLRWEEYCPAGDIAITKGPFPIIRPRMRTTLYWKSVRRANATLSTLLGHLLHEMLHAYLMILTGGGDAEGGHGEYHGSCYRRCAHAIARSFHGEISVMEDDED